LTALKLIGTYRVSVSDEELQFITDEVTGSEERTREEVNGLVLLEFEVRDAPADFDPERFHQVGSEQVAYDQRYFTVDDLELIGSERPGTSDFRICFFLHHFDPLIKVTSPYGEMTSAGLTDMPERLASDCIYEHPG
jgi:hypothetical protein